MASGYGFNGGPSRCFPFWQELLACYVMNEDKDNPAGIKACVPALADYQECLHHKKERERVASIQRAMRRAEQVYPRESGPDSSTIRNLGLLNRDEDTKKVLDARTKS